MRTSELVNALSRADPGVEFHFYPDYTVGITLYKPQIDSWGESFFEVAFDIAKQLFEHPDCPPQVKDALLEYDRHTEMLSL